MSDLQQELQRVLSEAVGDIVARALLVSSVKAAGLDLKRPRQTDIDRFLARVAIALRVHMRDDPLRLRCTDALGAVLKKACDAGEQARERVVAINSELDIVLARNAGQELCHGAGFPPSMQVKVATAISELARNIARYAGTGSISLAIKPGPPLVVEVIAHDNGPGIADLDRILRGAYVSKTGMGKGLLGVKALMDEFDVQSAPGKGTTVTARKRNR